MVYFEELNEQFIQMITDSEGRYSIKENDKEIWLKEKYLIDSYLQNTSYSTAAILRIITKILNPYYKYNDPKYVSEHLTKRINQEKRDLEKGSKTQLVPSVPIYRSEMEKLELIPVGQCRVLGFTFLVLGKYHYNKPELDDRHTTWIASRKSDIFDLAGFNDSSVNGDSRADYLNKLWASGLVDIQTKYTSEVDLMRNPKMQYGKLKYRVNFMEFLENEEPAFVVKNYYDMRLYYLRYIGDSSIISCKECGEPIIKTANKKMFCDDCQKKKDRARKQKPA